MPAQFSSWRDVLKVHPAVGLFPKMLPDELRELGEDIRKQGLTTPIVLWLAELSTSTSLCNCVLLDGCNRLDAMELVGLPVINDEGGFVEEIGTTKTDLVCAYRWENGESVPTGIDPYEYVIALNIRRRHLTAEQRRDLIGELLKAQPEKSNRQIAAQVKSDHKTVGTVREKLEATGEIPQLETTVGKDGKARPAERRAPPAVTSTQAPAAGAINTPRPGVPKPPGSASIGMRLHREKIDAIVKAIDAIHRIAGNGLDVRPKEVLASCDTQGKRTNLLSSARLAHKWLGELLEVGRPSAPIAIREDPFGSAHTASPGSSGT